MPSMPDFFRFGASHCTEVKEMLNCDEFNEACCAVGDCSDDECVGAVLKLHLKRDCAKDV